MLRSLIVAFACAFFINNSLFAITKIDSLSYKSPVLQLGAPGHMSSDDSAAYNTLIQEFEEVVHFNSGDTLVVMGRGTNYCPSCALQIQQKRADWWCEYLYQHIYPGGLESCHWGDLSINTIALGTKWPILPCPKTEAEEAMNRFTDVRLSPYKENALMDSLLGYEDLYPHLLGLEIGKSTVNQTVFAIYSIGLRPAIYTQNDPHRGDGIQRCFRVEADSVSFIVPWEKVDFVFQDSVLQSVSFENSYGMSDRPSKKEKALFREKSGKSEILIDKYYAHFIYNPDVNRTSKGWTDGRISMEFEKFPVQRLIFK